MRQNALLLFCVSALLVSSACGDNRRLTIEDGAVSVDAPRVAADSQAWRTDIAVPQPDLASVATTCVVAVRVDACCQLAIPSPLSAVASDPCLLHWPVPVAVPAECKAQWDPQCALDSCGYEVPPSRVARLVEGQCRFADECQTADDCVVATDVRFCCACEDAHPKALLELQPCLLMTSRGDFPENCEPDCHAVLCEECRRAQSVECVLGNPWNSCHAVY